MSNFPVSTTGSLCSLNICLRFPMAANATSLLAAPGPSCLSAAVAQSSDSSSSGARLFCRSLDVQTRRRGRVHYGSPWRAAQILLSGRAVAISWRDKLPTAPLGIRTRRGSFSFSPRAQLSSDVDETSPVPSVAPPSQTPGSSDHSSSADRGLVGEDAAVFELSNQRTSSWVYFTIVLGLVLGALYVLWIDPSTGYGTDFIAALSSLSDNPEVVILAILLVFALAHSGLASLRDAGEKLIGERAYRVLFGVVSLPLAVSAVVYFINHRYDGIQLWQLHSVPGVHELVWLLSFVSFFFLYPSTFNLLEVAAVDKPKMHMWETGIMRITRHPQMVGQFMWCLAHTLWIGTSFTLVTSLGLCVHHLFGVWNGDRRLAKRYGQAFEEVKRRTSVVPFAAILDGRQELPEEYYKEFLRVPYFAITALTLGAYFSHPLLRAGSSYLGW